MNSSSPDIAQIRTHLDFDMTLDSQTNDDCRTKTNMAIMRIALLFNPMSCIIESMWNQADALL